MADDDDKTSQQSPPAAEEARPAAEAAEHTVAELDHHGDKLEQDIEDVRADWKHKQDDQGVPGAVPDPEDRDDAGATSAEQGDAEDEAG